MLDSSTCGHTCFGNDQTSCCVAVCFLGRCWFDGFRRESGRSGLFLPLLFCVRSRLRSERAPWLLSALAAVRSLATGHSCAQILGYRLVFALPWLIVYTLWRSLKGSVVLLRNLDAWRCEAMAWQFRSRTCFGSGLTRCSGAVCLVYWMGSTRGSGKVP
jgi:hypothetical protein